MPLTLPDPGAIAKTNPQSIADTFGQALNTVNVMQQMQARSLDIQQKQATLPTDIAKAQAESSKSQSEATQQQISLNERQALIPLLKNLDSFSDPHGNPDYNRLIPAIMQAAPTTGSEYISQIARAAKESTDARTALNTLDASQQARVGQYLMGMAGNSPDALNSNLEGLRKTYPNLAPSIDYFKKYFIDPASAEYQQNPDALKTSLLRAGQSVMGAAEQAVAIRPTGVDVNNNQQGWTVNTNPLAGQVGQPIPGTVRQMQVPPEARVFNPQANAPSLYGPQGAGVAGAHPIQAGPALGQENAANGTMKVVTDDFAGTADAAAKAPNVINILDNIKAHAKGSVSGVTSETRAYAAGLLGLMSIKPAEDIKTNYDLLNKNANMLASTLGGNTDMARTLIEGANPNHTMTQDAIESAANQVIGQLRWQQEKYNYMRPLAERARTSGDPAPYLEGLSQFNSVVPPEVKQYEAMNLVQRAAFKQSLLKDPAAYADFRRKLQAYDQYKGNK